MNEETRTDNLRRYTSEVLSQAEIDYIFANKEKILLMNPEEAVEFLNKFNEEHKKEKEKEIGALPERLLKELFDSIPKERDELHRLEQIRQKNEGFKLNELSAADIDALFTTLYSYKDNKYRENTIREDQERILHTLWHVAERFKNQLNEVEREILFGKQNEK